MNTFEIALKSKQLPTKIEEILPLRAMGNVYLAFCKAKIKELDKLRANGNTDIRKIKLLTKQKNETLADAQDAGEILLDWETEIGKISVNIEKEESRSIVTKRGEHGRILESKQIPIEKQKYEKMGLESRKELSQAQFIKNHPKEVEEVKKESRQNKDIATKTAVINLVRAKNAEKNKTKPKALPDINDRVVEYNKWLESINIGLDDIVKYWNKISPSIKQDFIFHFKGIYKTLEKKFKEDKVWNVQKLIK